MELKDHVAGRVEVLVLSGRFDAFEVPDIIGWFDAHISAAACRVVIDLAGVSFIDSAAMACLLRGMKRCREQGGDLYLSSLQQPVTIIFELTRLDKAFNIYSSEADAVEALLVAKP